MAQKLPKNSFTPFDNGSKVFEHYGLHPSNKPQTNPFRDERTPSFYVKQGKNSIYFKDFGNDSIKGNWYNLISIFENTQEPSKIYEIAKSIYNEQAIAPSPRAKQTKEPRAKSQEPSSKTLSKIEFKDFTSQELTYWQNKGNISLNTLLKLGVQSVRAFTIESTQTSPKEEINQSFVFSYPTISKEAYKLYMPKEATRPFKAKTVFLPHLDNARAIEPSYEYSFGIEHLTPNKPSIICEGEPDCLALIEAGFNAFTIGSVRSSLSECIIAKLKEKGISHISICFDTDYAGISNAPKLKENLSKHFSCSIIDLPKLPRQESKNSPKISHNDICDYISLYGFDSDLHFAILCSMPMQVQKYLSEISSQLEAILRTNKGQIISIKAPTGTGKTHEFIQNILPKLYSSSVFCVPTKILCSQIETAKEKDKNGKEVSKYNVIGLQGSQSISQEYLSQNVKVCTYDKLSQVAQASFLECIIIDESHLLSQALGYRQNAIQEITKTILEAKQAGKTIIFLSATPCKHIEQSFETHSINIERTINPAIQIKRLGYDKFNSDLLSYLSEFDYSKNTILCKVGSIKRANIWAKTLIKNGTLKESEIDFVVSEKRTIEKTETQKSIEQNSLIPSEKKLIFCTKILDTGTNINNTNIHLLYAITRKELSSDLIQFLARVREMSQVHLTLFEKYEPSQEAKSYKTKYSQKELKELASLQSEWLNNFDAPKPKSKILKSNHKLHLDLNLLTIEANNQNTPNCTYIAYYLNEIELRKQTRQEYLNELSLQGFELSELSLYQAKSQEPNRLESLSKQERQEIEKDLQEYQNKLCNEWQESQDTREPLLQDLANNYESKEIAQALNIERTKEHAPSQAKGILQANLFVKFFEFIRMLMSYKINDFGLQSKLASLHLGNASKLIDTLKNYKLLAYDKESLSLFVSKSYDKERGVLERIIKAVQTIAQEQSNEYKTKISQAKRQRTNFENRLNNKIAQSSKKTSLNKIEQKQLKTLCNRIDKLEACSMSIELNEFLYLVRLKAGLTGTGISNKNLLDTICTLFEISEKRERRDSKGKEKELKTFIYVGRLKTFESALQELGFNEQEAKEFVIKSKANIAQEIEALKFTETTKKQALNTQESNILKDSNITKCTRNYNNNINNNNGNFCTFGNVDEPLRECPF